MERVLRNEFSWSTSRHEKLRECLRAYYYYYYGSWGGWGAAAPSEVRRLYILKKLSNRFTWAGSMVHQTIRDALRDIRAGLSVNPEQSIARAHRQMREDYRHSADKRYWREKRRKDFHGLLEHEYDEPLTAEEWKRNWEAAKAALDWFFASRWIPLARSLKPEQWLEVDDNDFERSVFLLDGVRVFAVPDFAYLDLEGVPVVVDWKTGKAREGYSAQVLGYAIYLSHKHQVAPERVRASLVYLNEGTEKQVRIDAAALEGFQQHFSESVGRMRALLRSPEDNVPVPMEQFTMAEDLATCQRCAFRAVCGRTEARAQVPSAQAMGLGIQPPPTPSVSTSVSMPKLA